MTLFKKTKGLTPTPILMPNKAQEIYELFKAGKDETTMYIEDGIRFDDSTKVKKEYIKLESEMVSKMNGTYELTPYIPPIYDEDGNIITPAVSATYYAVTTENALKDSISSNLLVMATLVKDVREWSEGKPTMPRTWTKYKTSFTA